MDSNWVLVIITAIYVVATIGILFANKKSAKAANEQLTEMKNQFEINDSPSVEVEFHHFDDVAIGIRVVNHGKHTAQEVQIEYSEKFSGKIEAIETGFYKTSIDSIKGKKCVLGVGQYTDLLIANYQEIKGLDNKPPICGKVSYSFRNKDYSTDFYFDIDDYINAFRVTCHEDELQNAMNETSAQLKGLNYHETMKAFEPRRIR